MDIITGTPSVTLTTLPPEVRNEIYSHVVKQMKPIQIFTRAPRRRRTSSQPLPPRLKRTKRQRSVLFVSKQIYEEAGAVYFSQNTFMIGNGREGHWNDYLTVSAFNQFMAAVPDRFLACIRRIDLVMYCKPLAFYNGLSRVQEALKPFLAMCRMVVKKMTGLRALEFYLLETTPCQEGGLTGWGGNSKVIEQALRMFMRHQKLREIVFNRDTSTWLNIDVDTIVNHVARASKDNSIAVICADADSGIVMPHTKNGLVRLEFIVTGPRRPSSHIGNHPQGPPPPPPGWFNAPNVGIPNVAPPITIPPMMIPPNHPYPPLSPGPTLLSRLGLYHAPLGGFARPRSFPPRYRTPVLATYAQTPLPWRARLRRNRR